MLLSGEPKSKIHLNFTHRVNLNSSLKVVLVLNVLNKVTEYNSQLRSETSVYVCRYLTHHVMLYRRIYGILSI